MALNGSTIRSKNPKAPVLGSFAIDRYQEKNSSDRFAILTSPRSKYRYYAKQGDIFQAVNHRSPEQTLQVVEIRPTKVSVKDLATKKIFSVPKP